MLNFRKYQTNRSETLANITAGVRMLGTRNNPMNSQSSFVCIIGPNNWIVSPMFSYKEMKAEIGYSSVWFLPVFRPYFATENGCYLTGFR